MAITMRALRDFRGRNGEGYGDRKRLVDAGMDFKVADDGRATYLERMGMAQRILGFGAREATVFGSETNEAAAAGPLASTGGQIGEGNAPSSSAPAPAPAASTSPKPRAARASSPSTKAGASPRGRKSSTAATASGGAGAARTPASKA